MKILYALSIMAAAFVLLVFNAPPVQAAKVDSRIESAIKESHVFRTYLKDDDINIKSENGAVTLTGTVQEESHKALAQDTVSGLPGVKSVNNKLEVKGETPSKTSDAWLLTKVKSMLLFHRSVSAGTEVDVKDGIVTLRGTADTQEQKDLTTEYAKDVEGVKEVNNEMTVSKPDKKRATAGEKIDDASITAQVKMTLLSHRSTSAINTKVKTKHGVVTLSGKAKDTAEKDLVTKLAKDIKGVKSVRNQMIIE